LRIPKAEPWSRSAEREIPPLRLGKCNLNFGSVTPKIWGGFSAKKINAQGELYSRARSDRFAVALRSARVSASLRSAQDDSAGRFFSKENKRLLLIISL